MILLTAILKEILKDLPQGKISDACFEGANIVLYTKDKEFFMDNKGIIKTIVDKIKKRIELRPDPAIALELEKAENLIRELVPEEAGMSDVIFDTQRSRVIIHAEKPGLVIGKQGQLLREIREKTLWVPLIKRSPPIRSQLIENIRSVLYDNSDYRRKFLDKTGHRIYDGWIRGKKEEWIRLSYLGGARQVGRSCILLQTPESRILLDCGINVASDECAYPYLEAPEFKIEDLDAVIVSHAHLDHSGLIPYLYKFGYRGPVYCTAPTRDIMALLHLDLVKIMRGEGKDPIYTSEEVREMVKHTICLGFNEVTDVTPDVRITLYNSGHILGSAMVHLHIGNGLHNMLYGADMKYANTRLLERAETKFPRLETLMIEATYGGRDNVLPPVKAQEESLREEIKETLKRGGKILIPTLGSGRAQEIMMLIEEMVQKEEIEPTTVFIDGMVWDITAIHTAYPEFLNSSIRKQIFHKDNNPFLSPIFKRVGSAKERKQVIEDGGPCIIVATSGMLVGGPSVEYLKAFADDARNLLVFSCYQAEGSLGKKIREGQKEIVMKTDSTGKPDVLHIKMQVEKIEITGHADRRELMNFVGKCVPRPKKIVINHGENSRCLDLASSLHKQYRVETNAPRNLEAIRVR